MAKRTIMLSAGGTGGHLFPAYALAEELTRRDCAVDLITDMRGDRYAKSFPGRTIHKVAAATLGSRSVKAFAQTGFTLSKGIAMAHRILGQVKPQAVIGFGGYPTFPPLVAARLRGIPTALHEQNAILGKANRMLAKRVDAIATSFEQTRLGDADTEATRAKIHFTGNPVRDVVRAWSAKQAYEPPAPIGQLNLLVFGGSQGARYFSDVMPVALAALSETVRQRFFVVQQCREEDLERVRAAYAAAGIEAHLAAFFDDLPEAMAKAHLIIARAGASTLAELTVMGRPAILVPLPHALDNDQLLNATELAEAGAGWCIQQDTLSDEQLGREIERLLSAPSILATAAAKAREMGPHDAVARLADLVERLANGGTD
ncbi:MAG: undecaprenyldiphospho-muramoylpentapeptide beta-N-acetylglucosaminyltransferase [Pseudomonadota bacterium]